MLLQQGQQCSHTALNRRISILSSITPLRTALSPSFLTCIKSKPSASAVKSSTTIRSRQATALSSTRTFTHYTEGVANGAESELDTVDNLAVEVHPTEATVGAAVVREVLAVARAAVRDKGHFSLAIPGGSVLKMLAGLADTDFPWKDTTIFYANHKVVPIADKSSTHQKAKDLFLDKLPQKPFVAAPAGGSVGGPKEEATEYEQQLLKASNGNTLVKNAQGVPVFDLVLLGMGADGHVGSLYPARQEVLATQGFILPVEKADGSASITFSLPLMNAATKVIIAATGAKKAPAVLTSLQTPVPKGNMPAQLVRPQASGATLTWLLDAPAAMQVAFVTAVGELIP